MPSQILGEERLNAVLIDLQQTLRYTLETLNSENVAEALEEALHNDNSLPDKAMARLASGNLNLLGEVEKLLQPAHLVLADHFFGMSAYKALEGAKIVMGTDPEI